jgi:RND family efflux transporter MFP subunit
MNLSAMLSTRRALLPLSLFSLLALSACQRAGDTTQAASGASAPANSAASVLTVQLVPGSTRNWPERVQGSGALSAWQEAVISTEVGSYRIAELLVDVGAKVHKGQLMARLASDSLQADVAKQEAAVAQAQAALHQAQADAKRARAVSDSGALSPQKIDEYLIAEQTQQAALASAQASLASVRLQLSQTRITAVDAGVVSSRTGVLGNVVAAGTELFRLVRGGKVEWRAELDATQLAKVRAGQAAQLTLPSGNVVKGQVRLVAPTLSSTSGRGLVYVSLPADSGAQAGTYASGQIDVSQGTAWTLPETAIVLRDGRSYAYTVNAQGQAVRHVVRTGRRQDGAVEVLDGLPHDSRVVASGGAFLSDGAQVTVAQATPAASKP